MYARILEDAPDAYCVLVDHMGHSGLGQKLRSRLASAGSDPDALQDRFRLLQRIPHHTYVSLFSEANHVLDTPGWNGGNSSFQSLSMGCPVLTLRGDSMRGRHTVSMLEIIELPELIAHSMDEYVALSGRLLHDEDFAQHCRAVIRRHAHRLFDDQDVAAAFRQWVLGVVTSDPS
jgi:predicted O-linked N-acetylglucosamine transferase (SPINDLY family)